MKAPTDPASTGPISTRPASPRTAPGRRSGPAAPLPAAALHQAAEWFALLRSGEASEADRQAWQRWLDGSTDHRQAWRHVDALSDGIAELRRSPDPRGLTGRLVAANRRVANRRQLLGLALAAGAGTLVWANREHATGPPWRLAWLADHRTATGEIRQVTLPDDGRVWLDTATAIDVDYHASLRRLALLRGEILVATRSDPVLRPFIVDTRHGRLQALGTRFTVELLTRDTRVTVLQGAVGIRPGGQPGPSTPGGLPGGDGAGRPPAVDSGFAVVLHAGQQARFDSKGILDTARVDGSGPGWPDVSFQARDLSVGELVAELRRYYPGHIGVAGEVADLRVFGSFPLNDIPRSLEALAAAVPVRIRRVLPWWISVEAR